MSNGKTLNVLVQHVRSFSTTNQAHNLVKAPIQLYGLEGRYAHAIFSAASKQKQLDAVDKDFQKLNSFFKSDIKLAEILKNPTLSKEQKLGVVNVLAGERNANSVTVNALTLISDNGRLGRLKGVVSAFNTIMSAYKGEVTAKITTAKPLDNSQNKELQAILQSFVQKGKTLKYELKVDPDIVGGMVIEIGDRYVDLSIASKVKLYTKIVKESV